jgi:hypothetical protein
MGEDLENSDSEESTSSQFLPAIETNIKKRKFDQGTKSKKSQLIGAGASDDTFINKIVDLVAERFKNTSSEQKTGGGLDLSPPTAQLVPVSQSPPLPFNNTILKNDDNDSFGKNITKVKDIHKYKRYYKMFCQYVYLRFIFR